MASQAPWQHGPAALFLVSAIALLYSAPSRQRLAVSGLAVMLLVACRHMDIVFAAAIVAWLAWTNWRGLVWFLPAPILGGAGAGRLRRMDVRLDPRGAGRLERLHILRHGVSGPWSGNLAIGLTGTLFSPNRGLFVFSPWIAVALASLAIPAVARRLASHSLLCVLLASLVPYLLVLSKYSVWWGGHCFGPRYGPTSFLFLPLSLPSDSTGCGTGRPTLVVISAASACLAMAIQCIGAFCYPSSWNTQPGQCQHSPRTALELAGGTRSYLAASSKSIARRPR